MSSIDDNIKLSISDNEKQIVLNNLDENGKLSCIKAFKVAKKINKPPDVMSAISKNLGIKITNCELGVFGNLKFLQKDEKIYKELTNKYKNLKIECINLWDEAKHSSLKKVGSTVKNSDIEVTYCQLGCFREKKGLKNGYKSKNLDRR